VTAPLDRPPPLDFHLVKMAATYGELLSERAIDVGPPGAESNGQNPNRR
jgi:hypothetical protein